MHSQFGFYVFYSTTGFPQISVLFDYSLFEKPFSLNEQMAI